MAKIFRIQDTIENLLCNALVDAIDTGGAGTIQIRSGAQNADPDSIATGTLLCTCTFSGNAFGAANLGVATANAITAGIAVNTGTAGHARILSGAGNCIFECNVALAAGTPVIVLDTVSIVTGDQVTLSSFTVEMPLG